MSDRRFHQNPRRVFPTWIRAVQIAAVYGWQTGRKFRVYRVRDVYRISRTEKRYTSRLLPMWGGGGRRR